MTESQHTTNDEYAQISWSCQTLDIDASVDVDVDIFIFIGMDMDIEVDSMRWIMMQVLINDLEGALCSNSDTDIDNDADNDISVVFFTFQLCCLFSIISFLFIF